MFNVEINIHTFYTFRSTFIVYGVRVYCNPHLMHLTKNCALSFFKQTKKLLLQKILKNREENSLTKGDCMRIRDQREAQDMRG